MTFQNIKFVRVMMAVAGIWGLSIVLAFMTSCVTTAFLPAEMGERALDYLEVASDPDVTPDEMEAEREAFWDEFGGDLTVQYVIQWTLVTLAIYGLTYRVARQADSKDQAAGYGVLIASGAALSYGLLCALAPAMVLSGGSSLTLFALLFVGFFIAAGILAGRNAGDNLKPQAATAQSTGYGAGYGTPGYQPPSAALGGDPQMYYNMGVQAALGGRREEARQHFTRVLQMQPRNVPAWLQLANLAASPEDAWNYVQQARAINPADPAVVEAVNVIWPQVAANVQSAPPPRNQEPYPGGQQDDSAIPRLTLPDTNAPDPGGQATAPGSVMDEAAADADDSAAPDTAPDDAPPPPPPPPSAS